MRQFQKDTMSATSRRAFPNYRYLHVSVDFDIVREYRWVFNSDGVLLKEFTGNWVPVVVEKKHRVTMRRPFKAFSRRDKHRISAGTYNSNGLRQPIVRFPVGVFSAR